MTLKELILSKTNGSLKEKDIKKIASSLRGVVISHHRDQRVLTGKTGYLIDNRDFYLELVHLGMFPYKYNDTKLESVWLNQDNFYGQGEIYPAIEFSYDMYEVIDMNLDPKWNWIMPKESL